MFVLCSENLVPDRCPEEVEVYSSSRNYEFENGSEIKKKSMAKKILFVLFLARQAAAVTNVASADWPWPLCAPCPGGK